MACELAVSIGHVVVGLRCWDSAFFRQLDSWCGLFQTTATPDFWLELAVREGRTAEELQKVWPQVTLVMDGTRFSSEPPLWEGEYDLAAHRLRLCAERAIFDTRIQPRVLNVLFATLYDTVLQEKANPEGLELLCHGCGITIDGRGFLFAGPSGAGKTTVARLAGTRTVLNDEVLLLGVSRGVVRIGGTPFLGGLWRRDTPRVPLVAAFSLTHAPAASIRALEKGEALGWLLAQVFERTPFFYGDLDRVTFLGQKLDLAADVLRHVPVYELRFRPDDSFWPLVESLEVQA
jgi:hypothetical protein